MKIEPNMYVRTKCGNIFKIIGGNADNWEIDIDYSKLEQTEEYWLELYRYNDNYSFFDDKNIIKSSFNIIDLIESGDYVNELPVEDYYTRYDEEKDDYIKIGIVTLEDYWKGTFTSVEDIKSIVTKEQFLAMEYKVESEE